MTLGRRRVFGARLEGGHYRIRRGAYGVALRDGRLLVVDTPEGRFLPGGAVEPGEDLRAALRRELAEETGYSLQAATPLGTASQLIVTRSTGEPIEKRGSFFAVRVSAEPHLPLVDDGQAAAWLPVPEAVSSLTEEASAWAVRRALGRRQSPAFSGSRRSAAELMQ